MIRQVNLLPKSEQRGINLDILAGQAVNFWIVVLVSIIVMFLLALGGQVYLKQQISSTDFQIANEKESLKSSDTQQLEKQVVGLNQEARLLETLKAQHLLWSEALIEAANLLPPDMKVSLISLDRETGKIQMSGIAGDRESVIKFWSNVKKSNYFKAIDFPLNNLEKPASANWTFTLTINPSAIKPQ